MQKAFKVAQIRDLLNQVYNEKITFSRFVEILNEHADGKSKFENKPVSCIHDLTRLRLIGDNITCLDCKTTWRKTK